MYTCNWRSTAKINVTCTFVHVFRNVEIKLAEVLVQPLASTNWMKVLQKMVFHRFIVKKFFSIRTVQLSWAEREKFWGTHSLWILVFGFEAFGSHPEVLTGFGPIAGEYVGSQRRNNHGERESLATQLLDKWRGSLGGNQLHRKDTHKGACRENPKLSNFRSRLFLQTIQFEQLSKTTRNFFTVNTFRDILSVILEHFILDFPVSNQGNRALFILHVVHPTKLI